MEDTVTLHERVHCLERNAQKKQSKTKQQQQNSLFILIHREGKLGITLRHHLLKREDSEDAKWRDTGEVQPTEPAAGI